MDLDLLSRSFTLKGISPLLLHSGQTADPLNQFSRAFVRLKKRAKDKTDEDYATFALLEWWAGLHLSAPATISEDGVATCDPGTVITIPAHQLDSCIREGARKSKSGKQACAGVIVEADGILHHEGPPDLTKLSQDDHFHFRCAVKVQAAKVMRTRPRFDAWKISFTVLLDPGVVDPEDLEVWLAAAGRLVGIGDWRPGAPKGGNYGRFVVEI
jgi:hypothetical protein